MAPLVGNTCVSWLSNTKKKSEPLKGKRQHARIQKEEASAASGGEILARSDWLARLYAMDFRIRFIALE
jgi:hypothetical protein